MHLYKRIKEFFSAELAKLRPLSPQDRLWYIWEYHKFPITVTICVLVLLISILCNTSSPEKTYLSNAAINLTSVTTSEYSSLTDEAHSSMGLNRKDVISISPFYLSFQNSDQMEHTMALQSLLVRIAANDLDLLFLPEADFHAMASADIYCNIAQLLSADLWDTVKDHAIYVIDPVTGTEYPAALDITNAPAIANCDFITNSVVVCISPTSQRLENCSAMIAYLFGA